MPKLPLPFISSSSPLTCPITSPLPTSSLTHCRRPAAPASLFSPSLLLSLSFPSLPLLSFSLPLPISPPPLFHAHRHPLPCPHYPQQHHRSSSPASPSPLPFFSLPFPFLYPARPPPYPHGHWQHQIAATPCCQPNLLLPPCLASPSPSSILQSPCLATSSHLRHLPSAAAAATTSSASRSPSSPPLWFVVSCPFLFRILFIHFVIIFICISFPRSIRTHFSDCRCTPSMF